MSAKLDNTCENKNVNDYLTEVIQHLMSVDGVDVELILEVSVSAPSGIRQSGSQVYGRRLSGGHAVESTNKIGVRNCSGYRSFV